MPTTLLHWSTGNDKLQRTKTVSFGLPAYRSADNFLVCPGSLHCIFACYARHDLYLLPAAIAVRELNLAIARHNLETFKNFAIADLARIRTRSIRIHDSGDFFSQEYLDAWFAIVRAYPKKRFYCYTKSLHLDWTDCPRNLTKTQSIGGRFDHLIDEDASHTRVFSSHEARKAAGYCDGNTTDRPAQRGEQRIGLVYHGTKKLSPAQLKNFTKEEITT